MLKQKRMSMQKINELFRRIHPDGGIYRDRTRPSMLCVHYTSEGKVYRHYSLIEDLASKLNLIEHIDLHRFYVQLTPPRFFTSKFNLEKALKEKKEKLKEARELIQDQDVIEYIEKNIGNLEALGIEYYRELV